MTLIEASCNENQTSTDGSAWGKVKCSFFTGGRHLKDGWITAVDGVNRIKQQIHGTSTMVEEKSFEAKVGESQIDESQIHNYRRTSRADHQLNDISTITPESSTIRFSNPRKIESIIRVPNSCPFGFREYYGQCREEEI